MIYEDIKIKNYLSFGLIRMFYSGIAEFGCFENRIIGVIWVLGV